MTDSEIIDEFAQKHTGAAHFESKGEKCPICLLISARKQYEEFLEEVSTLMSKRTQDNTTLEKWREYANMIEITSRQTLQIVRGG